MNRLEAAEKLLNGTLTVEEYQALDDPGDYCEAVLYLARLRIGKQKMDHFWWKTVNGEPWLEAFELGPEVHIGPRCADCGYMQCMACQAVAPGFVAGQVCSGKGKHE